jgi:hypothetical protein
MDNSKPKLKIVAAGTDLPEIKVVNVKTLKRQIRDLDLDLVFPTPFNPPIRTANRTGDIDELGRDIVTNGQLESIHVVEMPDGTFVAVDGNRRRAAARKAGLKTIRAIVYGPGANDPNEVVRQLFVDLNDNKRRLANRDQTEIAVADGPIFNSNVQSTYNQLQELFPSGLPQIVKENAGTYVLSVSKRAVAHGYPSLEVGGKAHRDRVAMTLLWMIRNKQQQKVIAYIRNNFSAAALRRAIENNKVTPRVNG